MTDVQRSIVPTAGKPGRRKMHIAMVVWGAIVAIWVVAGIASSSEECSNQADQLSSDACAAGAGIGVALVLFLGIVVMGLLALVSLATRPSLRACPRCGSKVKNGFMQCWSCGFDFSSIGRTDDRPVTGQGGGDVS